MATWLTSPFESNESGNLVMGTIRRDVDKFRKAIEKIPGCPHANECPVSRQLWDDEGNDDNRQGAV